MLIAFGIVELWVNQNNFGRYIILKYFILICISYFKTIDFQLVCSLIASYPMVKVKKQGKIFIS